MEDRKVSVSDNSVRDRRVFTETLLRENSCLSVRIICKASFTAMLTRDQGFWSIPDKVCPLLRQDADVSGPEQEEASRKERLTTST